MNNNNNHNNSESPNVEYPVEGLSCANCTREMQEAIQKLEYGSDARLSYVNSKLTIHPNADISHVDRILKGDGARIIHIKEHSLDDHHEHPADPHHGHSHDAEGNQLIKWLLGIAVVIYLLTFVLKNVLPEPLLIAMYMIVIALSGYSTFWRGLNNLIHLKFNMDTLMTVALTGAVVIGEWKEATLVAILFGVNELLEGYGMDRARKSIKALLANAPKEAALLSNGNVVHVPISSLRVGDLVRVRAGEKIPSDGIINDGNSSVNEAAITGESIPVTKKPGDYVYGGSVNTDGLLDIRIEKAYEESSLAKIMHLVQEAQDSKTPTELFIDKFAKYYTPAIMIVAILVILIPPLLLGQPWMKWVYQGLAILIVGCPCSLVLSSPIALVSGMTRSARNGILIKGGVHLEQLGKMQVLAFDKTGTLTQGVPSVMEEAIYDPERFYDVAGTLEQSSLHPLAKAIVRHIYHQHESPISPESTQLTTLPGLGIQGEIGGRTYWMGSEDIITHVATTDSEQMNMVNHDILRLKEQGLTLVITVDETHVLGIFGLADTIRPETKDVIRQLHQAGITQTVMLTGDHEQSAQMIATEAGVSSYYAGLLPEQKVDHIKRLSSQWKVAMVGDGINDAPALATAQLGIAMGKGTDSAMETADIVLMQDHLGKLPSAIHMARQVNRIIGWNIGISLSLKAIALLLTIPGWLTLWIAILSDMGATIIVTLLGMTILLGKDQS
ncbi:heavy metal translocating P-type ATPase [Paenibacillus crassostreae]|uniref:Cd(2+)-exporting ATPase n=1 Tax=Paenibacillus crassostreae TaxID=1763538 RepID=A0A167D4J2_9BACL|nr:heavy metal translocating P-type ATPase [Paenibacillus crassostreae]AOZ92763.1 cadmium transporter [Paenibacillus crassostreae]OAB73925.1 cadmium transporter [Paenibacillus crassostreae]